MMKLSPKRGEFPLPSPSRPYPPSKRGFWGTIAFHDADVGVEVTELLSKA